MFRRHFILSALVMPAFPTIVLGSGRKILVAYYSWYDNTFQEQIRPSDIDATTSASPTGSRSSYDGGQMDRRGDLLHK